MPKILMLSLAFPPDGVSTAYIMGNLAQRLSSLGHSVSVITTMPHYNVDTDLAARCIIKRSAMGLWFTSSLGPVRIWHVRMGPKSARTWARSLQFIWFHALSLIIGALTVDRQDVVISTSPPLTIGIVARILAFRWQCPSIYKLAELYPDLAIAQGVISKRFTIALWKFLERFVYKTSTVIVSISQTFKSIILDRGAVEPKVRFIPDFVDTDFYRPMSPQTAFSSEHGLSGYFVLLYAGNIGPFQDWTSILYAASQLKSEAIRFVIVGDGSCRSWLMSQVAHHDLKNIVMVDYQSQNRMPEINASCDMALVPLTHAGARGGFPSKIYSALASGKSVLVSARPDDEMAQLVTKARCGRAVPPEDGPAFLDAILTAYTQRDLIAKEGQFGRTLVEKHFTAESIAEQYHELIVELVSQQRQTGAKK